MGRQAGRQAGHSAVSAPSCWSKTDTFVSGTVARIWARIRNAATFTPMYASGRLPKAFVDAPQNAPHG